MSDGMTEAFREDAEVPQEGLPSLWRTWDASLFTGSNAPMNAARVLFRSGEVVSNNPCLDWGVFPFQDREIIGYQTIEDAPTLPFDPINHPSHYTSHPSGVECITITQHHNFCIGNAIKYLWRAGLKDSNPTEQDLKKAIWYIQMEIERIETGKKQSCH